MAAKNSESKRDDRVSLRQCIEGVADRCISAILDEEPDVEDAADDEDGDDEPDGGRIEASHLCATPGLCLNRGNTPITFHTRI